MSLLDILYSPECLHCKTLFQGKGTLCGQCLDTFSLLSAEGHCIKCFAEIPLVTGICKPCRKISHPFYHLASCFDAYGPARSIENVFSSGQTHLAKDIAAYFVIQIHELNFPQFGSIISVPNHMQNPHFRIAQEIAKLLSIPFQPVLRRNLKPYPAFSLKKKCNIINQIVLLVDTNMQTRNTMRKAAFALEQGLPEKIYGMTFCAS
ncbi:MAG: hypothetical protein K1000chlam2_00470 [Chlamydiae bacterium]|nr:hypothetical protein [Chlamydiota bacterium]